VINAFIANPKWKINGSSFEHDADTAGDPADADIYQKDLNKDLNVYVNDGGVKTKAIQINGDEGSLSFPRQSSLVSTMSVDRTISNATWTTVIFNIETQDTLGEYDNTTGIFTAKDAGTYMISAEVYWVNVDATKAYALTLVKNNTLNATNTYRHRQVLSSALEVFPQFISGIFNLAAGDTLRVQVYQNSGGNETINATTYPLDNWLSIVKVA
jgi:hypothetical protein